MSDAYAFTEEGSYVGMYSATHFELFYILFVTKKAIATETKADVFGHIQKGEPYLEEKYLEKLDKQSRTKVFYKRIEKPVFIHPDETERELSLDKAEYIYLADYV